MPVLPVLNHAARFQTGRAWLETKVVDDDIHILASLFNHCLRQISYHDIERPCHHLSPD